MRQSIIFAACILSAGLFLTAPAAGQQSASTLVRETGMLSEGDEVGSDGKYLDRFTFSIEGPREVLARVVSTEFDTYILYRGPNELYGFNDDFDGTVVSEVTFWALDSGEYSIEVTSYAAATEGAYEVEVLASQPGKVEVREGRLDPRDMRSPKGEYFDEHLIDVGSGESVNVTLVSYGFDGVVTAQSPDGRVIVEDGSLTSATVGPLEGPAQWRVFATSFAANELGAYDLKILQRAAGESELVATLGSPNDEGWEPLPIRSRVVQGPDWSYDEQGGNTLGTVEGPADQVGWHTVNWDNGESNAYRWGKEGFYEVQVVSPVSQTDFANGVPGFQVDRLRVRSDAGEIQVDQWRPEMNALAGEILEIQEVSDEGVFLFTPDRSDYYLFRWDAVELVRVDN